MEVVAGPRSPIRSPPHLGSIMERGSLHEDEDRDILTPLRNLGSPKNRRPPVREGTPVDRIRCRSDKMCSMIPVAFVFNDSPACRGSISEIYKGKKLKNNQTVILKHPSDAAWVAKGKHGLDNIFGREAKVLRSIDCKNVLKCHDFISKEQLLVLEVCDTDLATLIETKGKGLKAMGIMKGILTGLKTIHEAKIVHNDLHPRNILMQKDVPKIADFGVSREAGSPRPAETTESIKAPEKAAKSDTSVDCWAAGLIMCCLLSGSLFIDSNKKVIDALKKCRGGIHKLFESAPGLDDVSEQAKSLITGLLCMNPKERLSAHQALMHEWFEGPQSNDSEVVAEENIRSKPKHPRVKKRSALEDVGASNEENVLKVLKKNDQEPAVEKLI